MEPKHGPFNRDLSCMARHIRGLPLLDTSSPAKPHKRALSRGEQQKCPPLCPDTHHSQLQAPHHACYSCASNSAAACGAGWMHQPHAETRSGHLRSTRIRTHAAGKHNPQNVPDPMVTQPSAPHMSSASLYPQESALCGCVHTTRGHKSFGDFPLTRRQ